MQITDAPESVDRIFSRAEEVAVQTGLAKTGDRIIITGGVPVGVAGTTNLLKVQNIS